MRTKVRWLLPNDQIIISEIESITDFLLGVKVLETVTFESYCYRVVNTEIVIDEGLWVCVTLDK